MDRQLHRRTLLRAGLLLPLAACTSTGGRTDPDGLSSAASPSPAPTPTPSAAGADTPAPDTAAESPTPATGSDPRTVRAVGREALGLPAPDPGGTPHTISGLMLHHTAAPTVAAARAPARFRTHTAGHRDAGFVDVAYHWGVDTAGNVYELRDEGIAGETFTDYDPAGWLLVVCEGNFEESEPTPAMLDAVADVFAAGAERHDVDPGTLLGHRDRAATLCPGVGLHTRIEELVTAIQQRLDTGGVELVVEDDPAVVAAIEQG